MTEQEIIGMTRRAGAEAQEAMTLIGKAYKQVNADNWIRIDKTAPVGNSGELEVFGLCVEKGETYRHWMYWDESRWEQRSEMQFKQAYDLAVHPAISGQQKTYIK